MLTQIRKLHPKYINELLEYLKTLYVKQQIDDSGNKSNKGYTLIMLQVVHLSIYENDRTLGLFYYTEENICKLQYLLMEVFTADVRK